MLQECYSSIKKWLKYAPAFHGPLRPFSLPRIVSTLALGSVLASTSALAGGHPKAQITVGYNIDFDLGPAVHSARPIWELQQAADSGDALAQNNLAYLYTFGLEVPQDYREAVRWYASAAAQGLAAGQYNLASDNREVARFRIAHHTGAIGLAERV